MGDVATGPKKNGFVQIVGYLLWFFREACNYRYLIVLLVLCGLATYVNFYVLSEDQWITKDPEPLHRLLKYNAGYFVVFGGAFALQAIMEPKNKQLRDPRLWALIIFSVVMFSVRAWFYQHQELSWKYFPYQYQTTATRIGTNLISLVWIAFPCTLYWFFVDRKRLPVYGFKAKGVTLWPYFILLLMMVPLLYWAAYQPDFQETYPRARTLYLDNTPYKILGTTLYEIAYSLDFVVTEYFFRGFLILALARFAGPKVILPMCAFYLSIHFDKPMGEAISSFFGGLILGILAYRSGSIYGGIIVHLGIALLMELAGWVV